MILFSTARTTPSFVCTPTAVEPSCRAHSISRLPILVSRAFNMQRSTSPLQVELEYLDGLYRILDLENAPFWTESVHSSVVFAPSQKHTCRLTIALSRVISMTLLDEAELEWQTQSRVGKCLYSQLHVVQGPRRPQMYCLTSEDQSSDPAAWSRCPCNSTHAHHPSGILICDLILDCQKGSALSRITSDSDVTLRAYFLVTLTPVSQNTISHQYLTSMATKQPCSRQPTAYGPRLASKIVQLSRSRTAGCQWLSASSLALSPNDWPAQHACSQQFVVRFCSLHCLTCNARCSPSHLITTPAPLASRTANMQA